MRTIRLLVISLILFLALVSPASAIEVWGNASERAGIYVQDAQKFWEARGGFTDCRSIQTRWEDFSATPYAAYAWKCEIAYDPKTWRSISPAGKDCLTLHEYGHAGLGLSHVFGRLHIMNPTIYMHPHCYRRFRNW